jgi:chaperonin GroEL (HSP60 family)
MIGRHVKAVREAVKAGEGTLSPANAPLIALISELAEQMDAAGGESSTRLSAAYLSALKDLSRALASKATGNPGVDAIDELKAKRRRRVQGA